VKVKKNWRFVDKILKLYKLGVYEGRLPKKCEEKKGERERESSDLLYA
jgi:hypothetical protein